MDNQGIEAARHDEGLVAAIYIVAVAAHVIHANWDRILQVLPPAEKPS